MLRIAEDIIAFAIQTKISNTIAFLKNTFHPDFDPGTLTQRDQAVAIKQAGTNLDFYFQMDNYIESRKKKISPKTTKTCEEMKSYMQAFDLHRGEQSSFDKIDLDFFESFVEFLTFDYQLRRKKIAVMGLRVNTIFKVVKQ
jgi:Phage integrase SAM-like domain